MAGLKLLEGRLRLPVIGAPMFTVSYTKLVVAQCKAGIVGSFPALNARPQSELDRWLTEIRAELVAYQAAHPDRKVAPFAVNQIVNPGNTRLHEDLETCVRHKVPITITSLRAPNEVVIIETYNPTEEGKIGLSAMRIPGKGTSASIRLTAICSEGKVSSDSCVSKKRIVYDGFHPFIARMLKQ